MFDGAHVAWGDTGGLCAERPSNEETELGLYVLWFGSDHSESPVYNE